MLNHIRMGKLAEWRRRGHHERMRESYMMNFESISVRTETFLTVFRPLERRKACDSLQIVLSPVLNGSLNLDFEVLQWSKLVEFRKARNEKKGTPRLNACTSLADSYSSSQATAAREIGLRSLRDV